MTTRLTMEIVGVPYDKLDELRDFLAEGGLGNGRNRLKGTSRCILQKGHHLPVWTAGFPMHCQEKIHERFYHGYHEVKLPHKFKIAVGGCPE